MPPRKSFFWNGGFYHPGIEVFYNFKGDSEQEITVSAGDNDKCASNKDTTTVGFEFKPCHHMYYSDDSRVFDFGKCHTTSTDKDSFDMIQAKRSEYNAVLTFMKGILSTKCPGLKMVEQTKCESLAGVSDVVSEALQNLPDFRWIAPDSVLEKFEGQMYPSSGQEVFGEVAKLMEEEKKRIEIQEENPEEEL